ncbi:MAG: glycosyltransferase family 39 protein [Gemmatimonadaceae bacterium]|nr:glycosyltransferase family 39 protein [Gemmatimonadaceae bacterium]
MITFERKQIRRLAVMALLVLGAFVRLYQLDQYPLGVHQDELSNIYDGWSLAETGADRFGDRFPAVVRAFGERDYRPALYAWLAAIPQRFTGFSVVAGRLPAAVLGIASLLLIYAFARGMRGDDYAVLALLFAALSPLHIQFSRVAHEGGILPGFFLILILWLWQRAALANFPGGHVLLLGLLTGLSTNSYQSTRLTAPLLILVIAIDIARHAAHRVRPILLLGAGAFIGALPQMLFLLDQGERFFARARVLTISADNPVHFAAILLNNYWLNLEPYYLFVPRTLRGLTVARLLPFEIAFFYAGLIGLALLAVRAGSRGQKYAYIAMAVAILPAALTTGNPATMRASAIAVLTPLFSAAGLIVLGNLVRRKSLRRRIFYPVALAGIVLSFAAMTWQYATSPYFRELSFQKIGVDMGRALSGHQNRYDAIIIERYVSLAYIYVAAFTPIPPREFHRVPKQLYSDGMDSFTRLGSYYFVVESTMPATVASLRQQPGKFLFVSPTRLSGLSQVDSVAFQDRKLYFQTY